MTSTLDPESPPVAAATRQPAATRVLWFAIALAVTALVALASVAFGTRLVGWHDIVSSFSGDAESIAEAAVQKRVPRTVLALIIGAALGVSGAVMQGVTRNPLADPGILGVTSGASLSVVVGITMFGMRSPTAYIWTAILGAALAAVFVYAVGSLGRGGATPLKLALAGAASSAAFSSLISALLLPRVDVLTSFRFWSIGGVGGASWSRTSQVLPFLVVGALICFASARALNALALGDDVAAGLGERVGLIRIAAAAGAVLLCGAATAVAGPIGFVGLVVPHVCRLLVGIDHRWLLPFSAVVGAALLTAADVVGRVVSRPEEIDVGIITAIIGAPVFIWIVRKQRVRSL